MSNPHQEEIEERARRNEERQELNDKRQNDSIKRSRKLERKLVDPQASTKLGGGRLANLEDAAADNLLNPDGLFLGALNGQPIFYNGDAHLLNYGLTRSGKGTDIVQTNLAHVVNRSLVVNDIKDGENAWCSAEYRASRGHRVLALNPHDLDIKGVENIRVNPFQRVIDNAKDGISITEDCLELCIAIVPTGGDKNDWVQKGAQQVLATWLEWAALFRPDICNLSNMYLYVTARFEDQLTEILDCGHEGLEAQAVKIANFTKSNDQWNAYDSDILTALWNFRPDTRLAKATETTDYDVAKLKTELTTLYLMADSNLLEASSRWVSLMTTAIVNAVAHAKGKNRVTFIIDEMANLPKMSVLSKALTLYAGKGIQLWGLCQGRKALRTKGYTQEDILNFEDQSGIFHCWNIKDDELIKHIETLSGQTTVAIKNYSQGGGAVHSASMSVNEQRRAVLQSDDIRMVGDGKQIIVTNGGRVYVADRVHYYDIPKWNERIKDIRQMRI